MLARESHGAFSTHNSSCVVRVNGFLREVRDGTIKFLDPLYVPLRQIMRATGGRESHCLPPSDSLAFLVDTMHTCFRRVSPPGDVLSDFQLENDAKQQALLFPFRRISAANFCTVLPVLQKISCDGCQFRLQPGGKVSPTTLLMCRMKFWFFALTSPLSALAHSLS